MKLKGLNFLTAVAALAVLAGPVAAQTKKPGADLRLKEVERALDEGRKKAQNLNKKSQEIEQDLAKLRRKMVAAARIIQEQERRAAVLVRALIDLEKEEQAKLSWLAASRGQLAGILAALQRVARYPPEALITQPMPPSDTVRSAILLRTAVPEIEHRAVVLRDDLESLAKARLAMAEKNQQLTDITTGLEKERQRLAALFGQKTVIKHRTQAQRRAEARRFKSLAGEAATLRDLLDKLNKASRRSKQTPDKQNRKTEKPEITSETPENDGSLAGLPTGLTGAPISGQRGKLPLPAIGRIVGRFGQTAKTGLKHKGLTLETRGGAQVVAPYEGRVVYAGKFRGYGELLIIEHGEGYHSLLSGLARIDSTMGQWVIAGEPVGEMRRPGRRAGKKPLLYVEFRRNGQPINPLPWLAANR